MGNLRHDSWILLLGALGLPAALRAQTCAQESLSKTLTISTNARRLKPVAGSLDSCLVTITAADKLGRRPPQTIRFTADHLFKAAYGDCGAVRSYTTGYHQQAPIQDNEYGDLVVAGFNFDGRDDFAAKLDSGGNGGPLYGFYLQKPSGQFELSSYLTEEMQFFPARFDERRRTLTTVVHAGAGQLRETTYQVNPQTDAWREIRQRLVP